MRTFQITMAVVGTACNVGLFAFSLANGKPEALAWFVAGCWSVSALIHAANSKE